MNTPGRTVIIVVPAPDAPVRPWPMETWLTERGATTEELGANGVLVFKLPVGARVEPPPPLHPSLKEAVEGLRRLEYRGYDSAGIVVVERAGELKRSRTVGRVDVLADVLANRPLNGLAGLGRTFPHRLHARASQPFRLTYPRGDAKTGYAGGQ